MLEEGNIKAISTYGGKPHQQCCPLAGGPMPATMGPYPALKLLYEQHPHPTAGPLCHLFHSWAWSWSTALQPTLLFSWGPPSSVGPRHMEGQHRRGDPRCGTLGRSEILTVAAVSGCTWHGPWLVAGLGAARWHGMAQHGP